MFRVTGKKRMAATRGAYGRASSAVGLRSLACVVVSVALLQGCTRAVMPTPNIYANGVQAPFRELAPELQTNQADVLYVTDRKPERTKSGEIAYGIERSPAVSYGSAIVELGPNMSWDELVEYSSTKPKGALPKVKLASITELGRFPATPYAYQIVEGTDIELDPEVIVERKQTLAQARAEVLRRLALTPRKEVYIFVHGVGNSFDDAVTFVAQGWHFLGREGVPIAYTWPAGSGGLFFYAHDRESGEFTHFHFKQFMRALALIPEIEKIHLVAHSRGNDVVLSALAELVAEARAAGIDPREKLRIDNLVLIAPDLDFEVVMQRFIAPGLGSAFGRITIYANKDDQAISAATTLFSSRLRLGAVEPDELTDEQKQALERLANWDIVIYRGEEGGQFGHGYFKDNPAVSSDVVIVLRYGSLPGAENGRPLEPIGPRYWLIDDNYLN